MSGGTSATLTAGGLAASAGSLGGAVGLEAAADVGIASAADVGVTAAAAGTSLADVGLYSSLASSAVSGIGALQSGNASASAAKYNAQVAQENAALATQQSTWAAQAGEEQVGEASQKTRATVGAIEAAQAANNVDVNSGSAVDVRSSASALGELSALNIRSNAVRQAYGLETQATSDTAQSQLDTYSAQQSQLAGEVGAGSTILGGAGNAGLNYAKYISQNSPLNTAGF